MKLNRFVNWHAIKLNKRKLSEISEILGGKRLAAILINYARDYKFWNHGMPDLILWDS